MPKIVTTLFGALALIPQVAEVPVVEQLSFYTDQQTAYDGSEQNIQLRFKPRQTFNYQIPLQPGVSPAAFNTMYGGIRNKWAIPVWTDAQYVGNISAGLTSITCNTNDYDLRSHSLALLIDGCGRWQLLEIDTVVGNTINLIIATQAMAPSMLVPMRRGFVIGDITNTYSFNGLINLTFQVEDLSDYQPLPPDQFLGDDIYFTAGLFESGKIDTTITKRQDINDFDLGPIESRTPWIFTKFSRPYISITATKEERTAFRDFVFRRLGKARPFWMPTFQNDIRMLNVGSVVSAIYAPNDSFLDYATQRTHIAIEAAGVWYPRIISSVDTVDANTIRFNLTEPLNIPADSITRISYLGLNRLDSDIVEMNYSSNLGVETSVMVLEITP